MSIDLRDEFRQRYGTPPAAAAPAAAPDDSVRERAFVLTAASGRTVITAPLRQIARANEGFQYLRGRFVEADSPNRNKAMWTADDLEMGQASVAGGPLNWLHQETNIIGALMGSELVGRQKSAKGSEIGSHIAADAVVWEFLFPREAAIIDMAAADKKLWFSMECTSREVACVGDTGCGERFSYPDYMTQKACTHLNDRSGTKRFVDPTFFGGAIIVPPTQPGWANADVEVLRQAAATSEEHGLSDDGALTEPQARDMVAGLLSWANR